MIKLTQDKLQDVLDYMKEDLENCLYLYGDILLYGIDDPNMTVWYSQKDGNINLVLMQYFEGGHIYSREDDFQVEELVEKLREINPKRMSSKESIIRMIRPYMEDSYDVKFGGIFRLKNYRELKSPVEIEKAQLKDVEAIADLMIAHEPYKYTYTKKDMEDELRDRIEKGIGRSYIIRDKDRVVAHDAVTLETPTYAVEGLALVHDDFKKTLYGAFVDSYMINDLGREGKKLYCMIVEGRRYDAFVRLGNQVCARYGKILRKDTV